MKTLQLDDAFLQEVGLGGLSDDGKQKFLEDAMEMLQMNIGVRLSENLTDEQMKELEDKTIEDTDTPEVAMQKQQAIGEWLRANNSDYEQIVQEEIQKLKQAIRETMANS